MKNKVPKLRFLDFEGEWENLKIREIALLKGGFAFKSNNFLTEKSNYQVIKMGNLYQNKLLLDRNPSFLENITLKEKEYLLEKGDILITLTGTVGKRDFGYSYQINNEKNLLLNQRLALIKSKQGVSNDKFLKYIVLKNQFLDQFFEASAGGTGNQANVSIKNIEDFIVILPSLPEQEKIANFLSSVDIKIEKLEKKKELLEKYKKGMMQKLFSQKLRFKDENGNDYPEWEEKRLGEIIISKASSISNNALENNEGDYAVYGAAGFIKNINFYEREQKYIGIIKDGAGVGRLLFCEEKTSVLATLQYLIPKKNDSLKFIYYLLNTIDFTKYMVGSSIPHIYFKDYSIEKKFIPSLPEQEKIANFLSSIDRKIELVEEELEKNKEFKKGLLQQMFV